MNQSIQDLLERLDPPAQVYICTELASAVEAGAIKPIERIAGAAWNQLIRRRGKAMNLSICVAMMLDRLERSWLDIVGPECDAEGQALAVVLFVKRILQDAQKNEEEAINERRG